MAVLLNGGLSLACMRPINNFQLIVKISLCKFLICIHEGEKNVLRTKPCTKCYHCISMRPVKIKLLIKKHRKKLLADA